MLGTRYSRIALDVALESDLIDALSAVGKGSDALRRARSLAERASAAEDRVGELCGRLKEGGLLLSLEPEKGGLERLAALVDQALSEFEAVGNDLALYVGYSALVAVAFMRARMDEALVASEKAAAHARRAGLTEMFVASRADARLFGTTPVREVLAWLDEQETQEWSVLLRTHRAVALAMLGRFDEARAILAEVRAELADRGDSAGLAFITGFHSVFVEMWAGDPAAAAELGDEGCRLLDELGEKGVLSTMSGQLAQALYALDRLEEADAWASRAAELGASDDVATQALWRQAKAKVLARRGEHEQAEQLAREAVAIFEATDVLDHQGDLYADLGEVYLLTGKPDEAAAALELAVERYERKGIVVSTARAQARLAAIREVASR